MMESLKAAHCNQRLEIESIRCEMDLDDRRNGKLAACEATKTCERPGLWPQGLIAS